jgi:Glycine zipper
MNRKIQLFYSLGLLATACLTGCQTPPNNATQGAVFGGLFGAGLGAVAGHALGNTGAGAAIGAGAGALTGAAIGASEDRNQALIASRIGHPVGAATISDVVTMSHSGVDEGLIVNYVRSHGLAAPIQVADIIYLQQEHVSSNVIAVMQTTPVAVAVQPVYADPSAGGVIVTGGYYRPYRHYYYY